ncbi:uncharacterized protein perm1b isoform X2 [Vanacampus margaritifer]
MDDLDHSLRIAEEDWSNFYQESEKCRLPQPLLACPEELRCPDSSVSATQSLQSLVEDIRPCVEVELIQGVIETREDDKAKICNDTEIPQKSINVRRQAEDGDKNALREEKERWFVTLSLNDNPVRRRACATPKGKKTQPGQNACRPKRELQHESEVNKNSKKQAGQNSSCDVMQNICKETTHDDDDDIVQNHRQRPLHGEDRKQNCEEGTMHDDDREGTAYDGDIMKNQSDGEMMQHDGREAKLHGDDPVRSTRVGILQNQNLSEGTLHEGEPIDKIEGTLIGDDFLQTNMEGTLHDGGRMQNDTEGNLEMEDKNKAHEIFHLESVDSADQFEDTVEFFTLHSSGSEIYLSAAESVDQDLFENYPIESPSSSSSSSSCNCDPIQSSGVEILQTRESDPKCDGSGNQAFFPLTGHKGQQPPADLTRVQTEPDLTACVGDNPRSVPDVIVTPAADGPEAYAEAAGGPPCVYAISAFWDEMEKLTINDILQLRTARSPEMSDVPSQRSSLVDPEEHLLTDGGLADVSDAADSDYFTQLDGSKGDRSSWDFSVCDFEEDYWQFVGISRNPSPDLTCKTYEEEDEEEAGTRSQTPVPEDFVMSRGMTKNKSVQNVPALNMEDLSLHDDESKGGSLRSIISTPVQRDDLDSFIPQGPANVICVHDPQGISLAPGCDDMFPTCEHKILPTHSLKWKPVPIFSCSHPTAKELTLPKCNDPFLSADFSEEDFISPIRIVSHALRVAESQIGESLMPFAKIRFQDKGSVWCRRADGWELPAQREEGSIVVPTVGGASPPAPEQQRTCEKASCLRCSSLTCVWSASHLPPG